MYHIYFTKLLIKSKTAINEAEKCQKSAIASGELVAVERAPFVTAAGALQSRKQGHREFVNEIHGPGIDGDVYCAKRSDGGGRGIESDEMHRHFAVVTEGGRDGEAGSEPPRLSISTFTCLPSFSASTASTSLRPKSMPPTWPFSEI